MNRKIICIVSIVAVGLGGLLLWAVVPKMFFALLGLAGIFLLLLSSVVMVVTFRKSKSVAARSLVVGMVLSVLVATVYMVAFSASSPGVGVLAMGLLCGLAIGVGWGQTKTLFVEGNAIRSRGNAWYLVVWAMTLAVPQSVALLSGRPPAVGMLLVFCGTGLVLGQSGHTLFRYFQLKSQREKLSRAQR